MNLKRVSVCKIPKLELKSLKDDLFGKVRKLNFVELKIPMLIKNNTGSR